MTNEEEKGEKRRGNNDGDYGRGFFARDNEEEKNKKRKDINLENRGKSIYTKDHEVTMDMI